MQNPRLELSTTCSADSMVATTGGYYQHHHLYKQLQQQQQQQPQQYQYFDNGIQVNCNQYADLSHCQQYRFVPTGAQVSPSINSANCQQPKSPATGHIHPRTSSSPQSGRYLHLQAQGNHHHHLHSYRNHDPSELLHLQASSSSHSVHKPQRNHGPGHLATTISATRLKHLASNYAHQHQLQQQSLGSSGFPSDSLAEEQMQIDYQTNETSSYQSQVFHGSGLTNLDEQTIGLQQPPTVPLVDLDEASFAGGLAAARPLGVCGEQPPMPRARVSSISISGRPHQATPTTSPIAFPTRSLSFSLPGKNFHVQQQNHLGYSSSVQSNVFAASQLLSGQPAYGRTKALPDDNNESYMISQQIPLSTDGLGQSGLMQTSGHLQFGGSISSADSTANSPTPPISNSYSPIGNYLADYDKQQHHHHHQQQPLHGHSSSISGGSSSCSSGGGSGGCSSLSASDALSLGINLEQYISKRNERERSRVRNVNDAFDNLKNSLPLDSDKLTKRMSKVEILRTAINYIRDLEVILGSKQQQQPTNEQSKVAEWNNQDPFPNQIEQSIGRTSNAPYEPDNTSSNNNNESDHSSMRSNRSTNDWSSASMSTMTTAPKTTMNGCFTDMETRDQNMTMVVDGLDQGNFKWHGSGDHDGGYSDEQTRLSRPRGY